MRPTLPLSHLGSSRCLLARATIPSSAWICVLRQHDTSTAGYEAVTQGYTADRVLTLMPADPNTLEPIPPSLDALRDAYRNGMNVNAFQANGAIESGVFGRHTVLYRAVHWRHTHIVEWLLSVGADPNLRESDRNWTPLMEACHQVNYYMIVLLLHHGADVNAVDTARPTITALRLARESRQAVDPLVRHEAVVALQNAGAE